MENKNYFVYVKDIIGVETNLNRFHWSFGSYAPKTSCQQYEKCLIKIRLHICADEKAVQNIGNKATYQQFRHFCANEKEIAFCQKLGFITMGYKISIDSDNNGIDVMVGKNYYRYIQYKIMNVHPIWYVLYDVVSCLLLKNGLMVLYGSAVAAEDNGAIVFMGAPGVGKTTTAMQLCKAKRFSMISEDLLITDGQKLWPVPYTNTYRGDCSKESVSFTEDVRRIEQVVILEQGDGSQALPGSSLLKKASLLNRYGVQYYSSPTMMVYDYFHSGSSMLSLDTLADTEKQIMENILGKKKCCILRVADPSFFLQMYLNEEGLKR